MALDDWNQYGGTNGISATNNEAYEGSQSLELDNDSADSKYLIYGASESDSPTEAAVEGYQRNNGDFANMVAFFRYQDTQNFYYIGVEWNTDPVYGIYGGKRVNGTYTQLLSLLNEGGGQKNTWLPFTAKQFTNTAGEVVCRIESDGATGEFTDDGNHWTGGGGVGVGVVDRDDYTSGEFSGKVHNMDNITIRY